MNFRRRPKREPKVDPELWRALVNLLVRLIGETVSDKVTRAVLIAAIAGASQLVDVKVDQASLTPPEISVTVKPSPAAQPIIDPENKDSKDKKEENK